MRRKAFPRPTRLPSLSGEPSGAREPWTGRGQATRHDHVSKMHAWLPAAYSPDVDPERNRPLGGKDLGGCNHRQPRQHGSSVEVDGTKYPLPTVVVETTGTRNGEWGPVV